MAKGTRIDWNLHGEEIASLYASGLSVRDIIPLIEQKHGVTYPGGTLTNFLGRRNALRSKADARKLAIARAIRICELCNIPHTPGNYNQRWCDGCTGKGKYTKRIRIHGLPAMLYERMFEAQEHRCAICKREFESCINTSRRKTLFVDHDHATSQVRGLLCPRCNSGLSFIDDATWHVSALQYLEDARNEPEPTFVKPPRMRRYVRNKPLSLASKAS